MLNVFFYFVHDKAPPATLLLLAMVRIASAGNEIKAGVRVH